MPLPGNFRACQLPGTKWSLVKDAVEWESRRIHSCFSSHVTSFKHAHTHDRRRSKRGGVRREHTRALPVINCTRHTASDFLVVNRQLRTQTCSLFPSPEHGMPETIYSLVPHVPDVPVKPPMYKSRHDPVCVLAGSTFGKN